MSYVKLRSFGVGQLLEEVCLEWVVLQGELTLISGFPWTLELESLQAAFEGFAESLQQTQSAALS